MRRCGQCARLSPPRETADGDAADQYGESDEDSARDLRGDEAVLETPAAPSATWLAGPPHTWEWDGEGWRQASSGPAGPHPR